MRGVGRRRTGVGRRRAGVGCVRGVGRRSASGVLGNALFYAYPFDGCLVVV